MHELDVMTVSRQSDSNCSLLQSAIVLFEQLKFRNFGTCHQQPNLETVAQCNWTIIFPEQCPWSSLENLNSRICILQSFCCPTCFCWLQIIANELQKWPVDEFDASGIIVFDLHVLVANAVNVHEHFHRFVEDFRLKADTCNQNITVISNKKRIIRIYCHFVVPAPAMYQGANVARKNHLAFIHFLVVFWFHFLVVLQIDKELQIRTLKQRTFSRDITAIKGQFYLLIFKTVQRIYFEISSRSKEIIPERVCRVSKKIGPLIARSLAVMRFIIASNVLVY